MLNITGPRNVIYCNNNGPNNQSITLPGIAKLAYTDIIIAFLVPGQDGNTLVGGGGPDGSYFDSNLGSNIKMLHDAGKNVLISVGGATFKSQAYQNYFAHNMEDFVQQIVNFVKTYNFDGVDIDYEDNSGFTGTYDGWGFLNALTGGLGTSLPTGQNIITHAPQTAYWDNSGAIFQWKTAGVAPYARVWQSVGGRIAWINNQFYSTSYYDQDAPTKVTWYNKIAAITGAQKLVVGGVLNSSAAEGYISLDDMINNVIAPLQDSHGLQFGGVMGWQFSLDGGGAWGNAIGKALNIPSPGFINPPPPPPGPTSGNWSVNDLTAATNAPAAAGDPNGFTFTANGTSEMHVVYRGVDNDIHELYWQNGGWSVNDLTAATNAPAAAGDPNGFTFTANGTSGMHVVYRGADDDIHELYWQNGAWGVNDLTAATDAPAAAGDPIGFTFTTNGTSGMHVVYRGADNDIHELYWQNGVWGVNDLTAATGAPAAAGDPNVFMFTANGVDGMHVVYRGADNDIHELYWQNGAWSANDLTATTGAPAAAGDPDGFVFTADGTSGMHVVYRGADNDIHELYWQNGAWGVNDLTAATGAPAAAGDPNGFAFTAGGVSGMHVVYRGADNDIQELYWQNGAWGVNDLTSATGAPAAAGDPNGYVFAAQDQMHVVYPTGDGHIDEFWWAPASTSSAARTRAVKPSRDAKGARGKAPAEA